MVFETGYLILIAILVSTIISILRFAVHIKGKQLPSFASRFITMIAIPIYYKDVMDNDYPIYPGELEDQDTEDYITYLQTGILQDIDDVLQEER